MEMYAKTILVFLHFLLAALALAQVIRTDYLVLKNYTKPLGETVVAAISETKRIACWSLALLYLTGGLLVLYGMNTNPAYMSNEKLWVKFICVGVLTLNGYLVHKLDKHVRVGSTLSEFPLSFALQMAVVGAISSSSWIFACLLGIARAWNGKLPFVEVMTYYGATVVLAICVSIGFTLLVRTRLTYPDKRFRHD
ncbi:MAG: hypothetical protein Q4A84_05150 [Neisseria sp.]|uniref:hypothetical protein n=1 Tax=Neisseria sp. TaxID=192066 RepID=UPI0026DB74DF|nr:hypothetical protein [Neisseria sp.]MDO4641074.1 hypothetical protein [Neisseria sp.]